VKKGRLPVYTAALGAAITLFGFYVGGYDFDTRGETAVGALLFSVCFAGLGACIGAGIEMDHN